MLLLGRGTGSDNLLNLYLVVQVKAKGFNILTSLELQPHPLIFLHIMLAK